MIESALVLRGKRIKNALEHPSLEVAKAVSALLGDSASDVPKMLPIR